MGTGSVVAAPDGSILGYCNNQRAHIRSTVRAAQGRLNVLSIFLYKSICMGLLYGRAGRAGR